MDLSFLKTHRKITIKELSKKADVSMSYISELENNKKENPDINKVDRICKEIGIELAFIIRVDNNIKILGDE